MYEKYLVTGALHPVGNLVVKMLLEEGKKVRVLVPPEADTSSLKGLDVEISEGQIFDKDSMKDFFKIEDPRHSAVIHTEEIVSISSETNINMRRINVTGTNNVIDQCLKTKIGRIVCLGSAYAINPKSARENSVMSFDRTKVEGDYAKTKAEAAAYVMEKVSLNKLNVSLLLPTFIIGPGFGDDYDMNKILKSYLEKGVSPVKGGHAFVDVRDVALALLGITEEGQAGASYVLNGEHKKSEDFFADVSKANGSSDPVKTMPKWMMGKTFGKFVDTYYRISKKENPKEVYALFMNAPDQNFDTTAEKMLPSGELRSVFESINDVIHKVEVDVSKLVMKAESEKTEPDEEPEKAETAEKEEVAEEKPEEKEEKDDSILPKLNIPSVLGTLNAMSLKREEEKAKEADKTEETSEVEVEAAPEEEAEPEVAAEPETEVEAEVETEEETPAEPEVAEEATEEAVEEAVEEAAEAEAEPEEVVEETAEEVVEETAEETAEAEVEEAPAAEEAEAIEEVPEAEAETATEPEPEVAEASPAEEKIVPIWERMASDSSVDDLDDLDM